MYLNTKAAFLVAALVDLMGVLLLWV